MKKNMGMSDKVIRISLAGVIIVLYLFDIISGIFAYVGLTAAAILLLTSVLNFCPIYLPFGISTCDVSENDAKKK